MCFSLGVDEQTLCIDKTGFKQPVNNCALQAGLLHRYNAFVYRYKVCRYFYLQEL